MAKAFQNHKPKPPEEEDTDQIVIDDSELENAKAQAALLREQLDVTLDQLATARKQIAELKGSQPMRAIAIQQGASGITLPFPLVDANWAGKVCAPQGTLSMRFPEGSISAHLRCRLMSITEGLKASEAKLADGTKVSAWQHGLRWLLENIKCGKDDVLPTPKPGARF